MSEAASMTSGSLIAADKVKGTVTGGSREDINKRCDDDMDKDRIAGAAKQTKGAIKEAAGKVLGDSKLTADGKADKAEGKVQNAIGGLKDVLKE